MGRPGEKRSWKAAGQATFLPFSSAMLLYAFAASPAAPTTPRQTIPMQMMQGKAGPAGRLRTGLARKDPYGCYVSCSEQGFCPPKASLLQVAEAVPLAPAPRVGPALPAKPNSMGFAFPMLMFMGARKQRAVGASSNAQFSSCMQTCAAQLGCAAPPDLE